MILRMGAVTETKISAVADTMLSAVKPSQYLTGRATELNFVVGGTVDDTEESLSNSSATGWIT